MANWSIDPCGEHVATPCNCTDGKFTIPNESEVTNFIITYDNGNVRKEINYHKSKECVKCNCSDITFTPIADRHFSVDSHPGATLGNISYASGCNGIISVYGSNGISNLKIEGNTVKGDISQYNQTLEQNARILTIWFKVKGQDCPGRYEFYQEAFRGTDNGVDTFADVEKSHPIYFPGYKYKDTGEDEDTYCRRYGVTEPSGCGTHKLRVSGNYNDSDTIVSEGGAWIYYNNRWYQLIHSVIDANFPNGMTFGEGNWLNISLNKSTDGYCHVGMIVHKTKGEWDGNLNGRTVKMTLGEAIDAKIARAVRFRLATDPSADAKKIMVPDPNSSSTVPPAPGKCTCLNDGCTSPEHQDKECARSWWYDVIQVPKGHYVCDNDDGDYRNYMLLPLSEPCGEGKKKRCNCKCAEA